LGQPISFFVSISTLLLLSLFFSVTKPYYHSQKLTLLWRCSQTAIVFHMKRDFISHETGVEKRPNATRKAPKQRL